MPSFPSSSLESSNYIVSLENQVPEFLCIIIPILTSHALSNYIFKFSIWESRRIRNRLEFIMEANNKNIIHDWNSLLFINSIRSICPFSMRHPIKKGASIIICRRVKFNFLNWLIFQVENVQIIYIVLDALIADVIDVSDMTQIIRWNVVI